MKQTPMSRQIKEELWRQFDRGASPESIAIPGANLDRESVEKQHRLWQEFRRRNPR